MVPFVEVEELVAVVHVPSPNFNLELSPNGFEMGVRLCINVG